MTVSDEKRTVRPDVAIVTFSLKPKVIQDFTSDTSKLYNALLSAYRDTLNFSESNIYDGLSFERAFRADFVIESELILEVKAVESLAPIHASQVLTYMRLLRLRKGLLINFNVPVLKEGIKSFVL